MATRYLQDVTKLNFETSEPNLSFHPGLISGLVLHIARASTLSDKPGLGPAELN